MTLLKKVCYKLRALLFQKLMPELVSLSLFLSHSFSLKGSPDNITPDKNLSSNSHDLSLLKSIFLLPTYTLPSPMLYSDLIAFVSVSFKIYITRSVVMCSIRTGYCIFSLLLQFHKNRGYARCLELWSLLLCSQ